ncbi:MAG TPA: DUF4167 domain-containing protein [Rhizomicrobium sp.]
MTRSRQRGRRPQGGHTHSGGGGGVSGGGNRTFDSNGPEVKIRGSASNVYEKYLQLARDANSAGDRVAAENYLQHAEHYYRIMAAAAQTQQFQNPNQNRGQQYNGNGNGRPPNGNGGEGMQPLTSDPSFSLAEGQADENAAEAATE